MEQFLNKRKVVKSYGKQRKYPKNYESAGCVQQG